ncbi:hypothetical protein DRH27_03800 [Candidatus Falkowbacteria bacterium]|nr:MAG: hypothetical protein DRH27_03800 [Candidatus Falkowbacteria bacterium]
MKKKIWTGLGIVITLVALVVSYSIFSAEIKIHFGFGSYLSVKEIAKTARTTRLLSRNSMQVTQALRASTGKKDLNELGQLISLIKLEPEDCKYATQNSRFSMVALMIVSDEAAKQLIGIYKNKMARLDIDGNKIGKIFVSYPHLLDLVAIQAREKAKILIKKAQYEKKKELITQASNLYNFAGVCEYAQSSLSRHPKNIFKKPSTSI